MDEGEKRTIEQICKRRVCESCGEPATYKLTFLLPNYRSNPASNAYGRDDCTWCSDEDMFVCNKHEKDRRKLAEERGMFWCSSFPFEKHKHMFLFWTTIKEIKK